MSNLSAPWSSGLFCVWAGGINTHERQTASTAEVAVLLGRSALGALRDAATVQATDQATNVFLGAWTSPRPNSVRLDASDKERLRLQLIFISLAALVGVFDLITGP